MTRVLRRMGFSRKARPSHPRRDAEAQERFFAILKATAAAHPDKRLQLWFQDEARAATRAGCVVVARGERAPGTRQWLPVGLHLLRRAPGHRRRRHPGDAERQRQGHGPVSRHFADPWTRMRRRHDVRRRRLADERALTVPDNVTLALLPPYSPELNPASGWLYLANAPIAPRPRRHRGHHRRLLPSMDRPHRRTGSYANPLAYPCHRHWLIH